MINIDFGNTGSWAEERMIPYTTYIDLSQQTAVEELILGEIRKVNEQLAGGHEDPQIHPALQASGCRR